MATGEAQTQKTPVPTSAVRNPEAPRRHWAMNVVGIAGILALCYFGESVLVVMLVAVLLAFILAPIVDLLTYLRFPRSLAAAIAILLLLGALGGIVYYSYNQAATLLQDLPKYTSKVRDSALRFRKSAEQFQVLSPEHEKGVVSVRPATDWTDILTRGFGSVSAGVLAVSFVPFLVFFMLTWQQHVRSATVMLFPLENRHTAYVTLGLISAMVRSFMVGNLLIGLFVGAVSTIIFGMIHLPFFYFAGFASGFLSLVPYMGILLALLPPIFVGLGHAGSEDVFIIVATVIGLHLIALNLLYPRFLGKRLQLNPLAVTMGLLVWGALWGAMGLLLAIPITAAMKIIFDHVESLKPYGAWLGE
ncbi:MAG TPA: AI-2E family transporter [Terriglobales bacterium]|nr:AI-2E family transporter [Terriglobales bacterium]